MSRNPRLSAGLQNVGGGFLHWNTEINMLHLAHAF